jgi:hypothetical protein
MRRERHFIAAIGVLVCLFSNGFIVKSQQNNSLYFLDRVPQSIQLNPAFQPSCNFYFGIPALSAIEINAGNNALGVSDILINDKEAGQLVTPLYSKKITNETLDKLRTNNIIYSGFQIDLVSLGFRIGDNYLSFLISDKANTNLSIPKELAVFAYNGIQVGDSYTFDNFSVNANYYREYSLGFSKSISDKLTFGVRGKLLFGKMNVSTRNNSITLNEPDWKRIDVSANARVNMSIPNMNIKLDSAGLVEDVDVDGFDKAKDAVDDLLLLKKNKGFGFDIGFNFQATEKVAISASLIDIGYINWKANTHNLEGSGDYSFKGIEIDPGDDSTDVGEALLDTLKQVYDVTSSTDPYTTMLTPKLYVGLTYTPNRFIKLGLLARSEYVLKTYRQQLTGTVVFYPMQFLGATFSYTIADRVYDNLGIGLVFRTGPMQLYFTSERIPLFWNKAINGDIPKIPVYAKDVNFRMGFNLVFGANERRKLKKDQPFLE